MGPIYGRGIARRVPMKAASGEIDVGKTQNKKADQTMEARPFG